MWGLPQSPVVKTPSSNSRSMGPTHGRETKLPHTTGCGQKLKKKKRVRGEVQAGDAAQKHSEYIDSIFSLETG